MDQEEESFLSASDEEAIKVQYLLVEPQNHYASVDGVLCFHKENLEKCTTIIDFPGGPDPNASGEREDKVQLKVLDEIPCEPQAGHLQAANGVFTTCEDIIDIGFDKDVTNLEYESRLRNSVSENQISGFSSGDSFVASDSSTATPVPECQNNLREKATCELYRKVNSKCECGTSVEAQWIKCSTSSESQNVQKLDDVSNLLVMDVGSDKIEKDTAHPLGLTSGGMSYSAIIIQNNKGVTVGQNEETESFDVQDVITERSAQDSNVCARLTQKRSRKPTLRYIDESSHPHSRYSRKERKISTSTSMDKSPGVRFLSHVESKSTMLSSNEYFTKAIQVPFDSQGQKQCRRKHVFTEVQNTDMDKTVKSKHDSMTTIMSKDDSGQRKHHKLWTISEVRNTDMEKTDKSKCDSATTRMSKEDGGRRKHHKLWTISEVRKLIDGVSQYGVGKWTQIKRLLFSTSPHRTPVDLKDKWRNLLKASCAEEQSKKEDEKKRNQPWRPLPKSMLRRVSELAMIYPCPRDGKFKLSHARHVSSSSHPARRTSSPVHISGRHVHRKTVL